MKDFTKIAKALSDISRLKMLKLMEDKELCVCEIQSAFDFSQPTISKHLKVLEEAGLIVSRKKGAWVFYSINKNSSSEYVNTMLGNIKNWFNKDKELLNSKKKIKFTCKINLND